MPVPICPLCCCRTLEHFPHVPELVWLQSPVVLQQQASQAASTVVIDEQGDLTIANGGLLEIE